MRVHQNIAMLSCLFLLATGLAGGGCSPEWDDEIGNSTQAIVNGKAESGFPSVGRLSNSDGQLCTVSLIGHRTVLTAAHCVEGSSKPSVVLGGEMYEVASVDRHPQYTANCGEDRCYNDIAVLRLTKAPSVTPTSLSSTKPGFMDSITLVGFGSTGIDEATQKPRNDYAKRSVTTNVAWTNDASVGFVSLVGGGMICYGDSGGPSFAQVNGATVQIGVHSQLDLKFGPFNLSPCKTSAWDQRVDTHLDWIKTTAEQDVFVDGDKPDLPANDPPTEPDDPTPDPPAADPVVTVPDASEGSSGALHVKIASPPHGTVLASGLQVTVDVEVGSDVPIFRVDLAINGHPAASRDAAPFSFPVQLPDGQIKIEIRAVDTDGKEARATAHIIVDPSSHAVTGDAAEDPGAFFDCTLGPSRPERAPSLPLIALFALALFRRRR
jgi:hypothetical protein